MLKIRLMGTKNDIRWFEKILKRQPKVAVTEVSEMYQNKGTKKPLRRKKRRWMKIEIPGSGHQ